MKKFLLAPIVMLAALGCEKQEGQSRAQFGMLPRLQHVWFEVDPSGDRSHNDDADDGKDVEVIEDEDLSTSEEQALLLEISEELAHGSANAIEMGSDDDDVTVAEAVLGEEVGPSSTGDNGDEDADGEMPGDQEGVEDDADEGEPEKGDAANGNENDTATETGEDDEEDAASDTDEVDGQDDDTDTEGDVEGAEAEDEEGAAEGDDQEDTDGDDDEDSDEDDSAEDVGDYDGETITQQACRDALELGNDPRFDIRIFDGEVIKKTTVNVDSDYAIIKFTGEKKIVKATLNLTNENGQYCIDMTADKVIKKVKINAACGARVVGLTIQAKKVKKVTLNDLCEESDAEADQAEIDRIKEEIKLMKAEHAQQREALKQQGREQKANVKALKRKLKDELKAFKQQQKVDFKAFKQKLKDDAKAIKEQHEQQVQELKKTDKKAAKALKQQFRQEEKAAKQQQKDAVEAAKQQQKDAVEALKQYQKEQIAAAKVDTKQALKDLKATQKEELKALKEELKEAKAAKRKNKKT